MSVGERLALHVHRSNRMERLVDVLEQICSGPGAPFEPETIVVASKGMERWLAMQLAQRFGIWTNARYPFPRAFIDEAFDAVLGTSARGSSFSRDVLSWAIAAELPRHVTDPAFAEIRAYLKGDDLTLRLGLAERIAYVFDQYAVYRPELVLGWQRGEGSGWQPLLWRALSSRLGPEHFAERARRFFEAWRTSPDVSALPRRVSVVGVSSLPPIYLRVLSALAERIELHLLLLSPSREHTADVRTAAEIARSLHGTDHEPSELHLSEGNALFASLGRTSRELGELMESVTEYTESDRSLFQEPGSKTMLSCLQSDILALRQRSPRAAATPPLPISSLDRSIAVHRCHSAMRQVETLRDQLLGLFDADPSLVPSDVVVMMPDVEPFAPLIDAVFNVDPGDPCFIPYRVADRTLPGESVALKALLAVLAACRGRMKASELLDLLELEPLRRHFDIRAEQLPTLRRWVHESGIRWGVDEADRERWGQPALAENTWRFGLRRLLLGYALPTRNAALFCGALPYDQIEGDEAELLGKFVDFCERLFEWRERLTEARPLGAWRPLLQALFEKLIGGAATALAEAELLSSTLSDLESNAEMAEFVDALPLDLLERTLGKRLRSERSSHQFLSGGVTFCALLPMRSIPFRVVCLLGLDDGAFPRKDQTPSFDLMAAEPALGDRTLRHEDRFLFLEALLSARERLLVFYVGQGIRDGAERPPAVVVGELLDAVQRSFRLQADVQAARQTRLFAVEAAAQHDGDLIRHVTVCHPLQPFSPRYFDSNPALFSYARAEALGARALRGPRSAALPLQTAPLSIPETGARSVSVTDLVRFFENPARGLLQAELGLFLEENPCLVEDREPFEPTPLERYELGRTLLDHALAHGHLEADPSLLRASGALPLGTPGALYYQTLLPEVRAIVRAATRFMSGPRLDPLSFELDVDDTRIHGTLGALWPSAQLWLRYSRVRAKTELGCWIRHLVLCCVRQSNHPEATVLVGRPLDDGLELVRCERFAPLPRARALTLLAELVDLYWSGRQSILCLFPEPAKKYVLTLQSQTEDPEQVALEAAMDVYRSRPFSAARASANDEYVRRAFGGVDPLAPDFAPFAGAPPGFAELSRLVFEPLLAQLERVS